MNAHVFVPPSKTVIDAWEKLGNPGWNWNNLKSYYAKVHSVTAPQSQLIQALGLDWMSEADARTSGPIQTSYTDNLGDAVPKAWMDTFKALGYNMTEDPFSGRPMGAFSCLASIDPVTKERSYAATAYYAPAKDRQNLHVLTGSMVEKILFDRKGAKLCTSGVQFQQKGTTMTAKVRKEVIVAAGSLQSPKILELSGIGAKTLLLSHDIEVLLNNQYVGENLQDHIVSSIGFEANDHIKTLDDLVRQDPKAIESAMGEYLSTKMGPFASLGVSSYAYLPVIDFISEDGQKTLQELLGKYGGNYPPRHPSSGLYFEVARSILESKDEGSGSFLAVAAQSILPTDPDSKDSPPGPVAGNFITLGTMLAQPLSRGSVHISSSDPSREPIIDPKYLSHPLDMEVFTRHMRYLEVIAASEPFRSLLKENGRRRDPKSHLSDLDAAKDYVRTSSISMWHPTSTCAMLPEDRGGVVDNELRVYGTSNLRVVDASIFPVIPRANVQSTVYAVAERAADLIKSAHGL